MEQHIPGDAALGAYVYAITLCIILVGGALGTRLLRASQPQPIPAGGGSGAPFVGWDGLHYAGIASDGYWYVPYARSPVAFFPLFPLAGAGVAAVMRIPADVALTLVANVSCLGLLVLLRRYTAIRGVGQSVASATVLAAALWPTTFFFRMAYAVPQTPSGVEHKSRLCRFPPTPAC